MRYSVYLSDQILTKGVNVFIFIAFIAEKRHYFGFHTILEVLNNNSYTRYSSHLLAKKQLDMLCML
jgi:hypothetical protein